MNDPLTEKYYNVSPYVYAINNPLKFVDPDGQDVMDFIKGIGTGFLNRLDGMWQAISHPKETVLNLVDNSVNATPLDQLVNVLDNVTMGGASNTINFVEAVSTDLTGGNGSATGEVLGGIAAQPAVEVATAKVGKVLGGAMKETGMIGNATSKVGNVATKTMSPNVEKVINSLKEIKSSGGTIKNNPLSPTQELNMTIQKGGQKLDLRIETHTVHSKYGGNVTTPQKHMNVDLTPGKKTLPYNGHKIL